MIRVIHVPKSCYKVYGNVRYFIYYNTYIFEVSLILSTVETIPYIFCPSSETRRINPIQSPLGQLF